MSQPIRNVVIVGAGFGGLSATRELANAPVSITLIDQQNHHLFQPLLYQVATAALTPAEIGVPIRQILRRQKNAKVLMDRVVGVDTQNQQVLTQDGRHVPYDALIIATGARHSYFGKDQWSEFAPGIKTLNDAFGLREKILTALENAEIIAEDDPISARRFQTFVVVGGGPTGVEMAGAIAELSHSVVRDFRCIDGSQNRILLLEGGPRVLPSFAEDLSARAQRDLADLGVEVHTDTMVTDITASSVITSHEEIMTETVVWAAGVEASAAGKWLDVPVRDNGHVVVDETLRPEGLGNVYVIGDTAHHEVDGAALPGIAPVAKQMGIFVGKRLAQLAAGGQCSKAFHYSDAGSLATIGRNRAVADIYGMKITGRAGWLLWGAAHVFFLIGFKNRIFVLLHWLWLYLTWQRGVRLIIHRKISEDAPSPKDPANPA